MSSGEEKYDTHIPSRILLPVHVHLLLGDENEQPIAELLIPDTGVDKFVNDLRRTASMSVADVLREVAAGNRPRRH